MLLIKEYTNKEGKTLRGKVSPSNLRWYGVEEDLIKAYSIADNKLQAIYACKAKQGEEEIMKRDELFKAKMKAQEAIEKRLEEL